MKRLLLTMAAITALTLFAVPAMADDFNRGRRGDVQTVSHRHRDHHRGHHRDHYRHGRHDWRHPYGGRHSWHRGYDLHRYGYRSPYWCPPPRHGHHHHGHGSFSIYGPRFGFGIGW